MTGFITDVNNCISSLGKSIPSINIFLANIYKTLFELHFDCLYKNLAPLYFQYVKKVGINPAVFVNKNLSRQMLFHALCGNNYNKNSVNGVNTDDFRARCLNQMTVSCSIIFKTALAQKSTIDITKLNNETQTLFNGYFNDANIKTLIDNSEQSSEQTRHFLGLLDSNIINNMIPLVRTLYQAYCYNSASNGIDISYFFANEYINFLLLSSSANPINDLTNYPTLTALIHGFRDKALIGTVINTDRSDAINAYNAQCASTNRTCLSIGQQATNAGFLVAECFIADIEFCGPVCSFAFDIDNIKNAYANLNAFQFTTSINRGYLDFIFNKISLLNTLFTYNCTIQTDNDRYSMSSNSDINRFVSMIKQEFLNIETYYNSVCTNMIWSVIPFVGGIVGFMQQLQLASSSFAMKNFLKSINISTNNSLTIKTALIISPPLNLPTYRLSNIDNGEIPDIIKNQYMSSLLHTAINNLFTSYPDMWVTKDISASIFGSMAWAINEQIVDNGSGTRRIQTTSSESLATTTARTLTCGSIMVSYILLNYTQDPAPIIALISSNNTLQCQCFWYHAALYAVYSSAVQWNADYKASWQAMAWPSGKGGSKPSWSSTATAIMLATMEANTLKLINSYIPTNFTSPQGISKCSFSIPSTNVKPSKQFALPINLTSTDPDVVAYNVKLLIQTYLMFNTIVVDLFTILKTQINNITDLTARQEYMVYINSHQLEISNLYSSI